MGIHVGGGREVAVTEPLLNLLHRDTIGKQQGCAAIMKTIAIYCAGRNELPPPGIKGIRYFPDRACVWDKLAEQYPDTQLRIYFNLPGEFIVDMWPDIFRESDLVSYIPLDEDASVEDIAERIAADQPDLAIAFSIPILPYDWSALRDAMVGEELRRKGIKTIAHNIRTASHALEKDRCSDYLCQNGFFVAKSLSVRNTLFQAHKINTAIPVNVYREYVLRVIREMHFPVIIKPTVFSASDRLHVASDMRCNSNRKLMTLMNPYRSPVASLLTASRLAAGLILFLHAATAQRGVQSIYLATTLPRGHHRPGNLRDGPAGACQTDQGQESPQRCPPALRKDQVRRLRRMVWLKGLALTGKVQANRLAVQPEIQKRGPLHHALPRRGISEGALYSGGQSAAGRTGCRHCRL